jgi:sulfofructose kinase
MQTTLSKNNYALAFGAVAVDDLVFLERFPQPEEKIAVNSKQRQGGGLAGTALVAAARMGVDTAYCGVFGNDEFSEFSRKAFEEEGVDISLLQFKQEASPFHSYVLVDQQKQQRTILYDQHGIFEPQITPEVAYAIQKAGAVMLDHTVLGIASRVIVLAKEAGVPVMADIERYTDPRLPAVLKQLDHLIISERTAEKLSDKTDPKEMLLALSSHEPACCVVTVGDQGCWWKVRGGEIRHMPAFNVPVVDTTGCGDVFHGVYLAGLCIGFNVETSLLYATAAAGMKAAVPGGRAGSPTRAALENFLKAHASEIDYDFS